MKLYLLFTIAFVFLVFPCLHESYARNVNDDNHRENLSPFSTTRQTPGVNPNAFAEFGALPRITTPPTTRQTHRTNRLAFNLFFTTLLDLLRHLGPEGREQVLQLASLSAQETPQNNT